jgi:hypothetical protein
MGCQQISELGEVRYSPFPRPPGKKPHKKHKKQGSGACFIFDTLSITLVVSGPPFGSLVCLREYRDGVVDCSCESAEQSVYGLQISFLGHLNPFRCKTFGSIILLVVMWPVVSNMPIYDGFLDVYMSCMLHVLYICCHFHI